MSKQWKEYKAVTATSLRKCSLLLRAPTTSETDTSKLWSIACCGTNCVHREDNQAPPEGKQKASECIHTLTYHTEGLPGKAQSALPSSVATAAACRPDTDDVLQPKHHDHHELLFNKTKGGVLADAVHHECH